MNWNELNWTELTHSQLIFPLEVTTVCYRGTMLWQKTYFRMLTSMYSICIISIHKYIRWLRKIWGRWYDIWYDFRMIRNNWKGEKNLTFSYDQIRIWIHVAATSWRKQLTALIILLWDCWQVFDSRSFFLGP